MRRLVLCIDQGTTSSTALVLDDGASVVSSASVGLRQRYPEPGLVEHDPEEIWRSVLDATALALGRAGARPGELAGLGITNQRETTLVWERATGRPVHDAIVWQDRRSAGICRRLEADGVGDLVRRRTGLRLDPYFSATKLAWMLEHCEGLRGRAERGELAFGTVDSWLVWKLTGGEQAAGGGVGGAVHATDATNASRTMLASLDGLASASWDEELCELFGVPALMLPEIRPSGAIFGETAPGVLGDEPVLIGGVLGDQQASLFAQACFETGQTKSTYGTGSFVLQHAGAAPPRPLAGLVATLAFLPAAGPPEYALEGSIFATGAAVQWLRDGLGVISSAEETAALAGSLASNDDVFLVPALAGLGAPYWDPFARGTLLGATRGTTRAHLARAVLESIAYQVRDVLEAMAAADHSVPELRVDGGGSENPWLMQFQADVLGTVVDVASVKETTALGAGYVAGLGVGLWSDRSELRGHRRSARRYEPSMGTGERDGLYARWRQAVERARGWAAESSG